MLHPRLTVASAALLILYLFFGATTGSAKAQESVTLKVWDQFTGPEGEAVDAVYAAFTEANPNIVIAREVIPDQQMRDTANVALSSGTGPDIVYYAPGPGYAGVLADPGLIAPLDDLAEEYGWNERIAAAALEEGRG